MFRPPSDLELPIRAARETALAHGIAVDRCDILQNGSTLVLRLSEDLVARVVVDLDGPRQGTDWFARENRVALHLTKHGAPTIPLHPDLPPGPHEHLGFTLNFWKFVTATGEDARAEEIGETLYQCHAILRSFAEPLPELAILTETLALLETLERRALFPAATLDLLRRHLVSSIRSLSGFPRQALHGDAHPGNLMNTTRGLLWTDWEDTFRGPVEWDLASIIWNARVIDDDRATVNLILDSYRRAGGNVDPKALDCCLSARAAVMSAWYPVLYPNPDAERRAKLQFRIAWLRKQPVDD